MFLSSLSRLVFLVGGDVICNGGFFLFVAVFLESACMWLDGNCFYTDNLVIVLGFNLKMKKCFGLCKRPAFI